MLTINIDKVRTQPQMAMSMAETKLDSLNSKMSGPKQNESMVNQSVRQYLSRRIVEDVLRS